MESEDAVFSGSEEGGLDLLTSLLDNVEENEAVSKPDPSSDSRKRKAEEVERKGEKRRKMKNSCDNGGSELAVEEMRAKMVKMEEELSRLRNQVAGASPSPKERGMAAGIIAQRKLDKEKNCLTEKYSGIRIKNPLVSTEQMRQRMQGRKMVRIPRITSRMKDGDIEGDWVTMGVVVEKLPPRDTVKGKKFVIWRLSDLSSQTAVVSLFLFGQAYQEHWKIPQGHVVGLLNANIMPNRESDRGGVSLSLDHPQKLMVMGVSQDFTICKAHTKSGKKCVNFAKLSDGGYCDYHTQGAYRKVRSQRMEFQNGYGPSAGNIRERILKGSNAEVICYKGQSIAVPSSKTSAAKSSSSPEMDRRLFAPGARASAAKVSRELSEQREENGTTLVQSGRGVMTQEGSETFKQMLKTQTLGARMLSRHYQNEDQKKEAELHVEISASELLQTHKAELRQKSLQKKATPKTTKKPLAEKSTKNDSGIGDLFTPDCKLPLREEGTREDSGGGERDNTAHAGYYGNSKDKSPDLSLQNSEKDTRDSNQPSKTASRSELSLKLKAQEKNNSKLNTTRRSLPLPRVLERQGAGCSLDNPLSPLLGRGMTCGATIELTSPTNTKPSRAKLRALVVVQRRPQRESEDMAGGSKRRKQEAIQKRVKANRAGFDSSEGEDEERPLTQPKMAAAEVERIFNAKSSHEWAVKEDEWEKEQEYFDHLEKKEGLEEKLKSIRELRVTVVQCSKCGYVAEHLGELCRKENHVIRRFKAMKKCFQCKSCRERCYVYNAKYPADLCRKCGGNSFEPTSMYKERQGPKLASEQLLLRGTEEKYLNSLK